ncbi:MAG: DUF2062 domain-containing protein [Desulfobulbaceae bacterium]
MNLKRILRYFYIKFLRLKGDPKSLALGTAIGVLLGIAPIMPFQTILVVLVTVATRTSTVAAILSSFLVANPLTYVPQYYFSTTIGNAITPYELTWSRIKEAMDLMLQDPGFYKSLMVLVELGYEAVIVLLVGGTVLALPFAVASYFLSLPLFVKIKKRREQKHLLN